MTKPEKSAIDRLFDILESCGAKPTLYGKPTTREEVREEAAKKALERLVGSEEEGSEKKSD